MRTMKGDLYPAVNGMRAVLTLSLVALHTSILATSHFRLGSAPWRAFVEHPLYGVLQGGGLQVCDGKTSLKYINILLGKVTKIQLSLTKNHLTIAKLLPFLYPFVKWRKGAQIL